MRRQKAELGGQVSGCEWGWAGDPKGPRQGEAFIMEADALVSSLAPSLVSPRPCLTEGGGHFWVFLSA